MSGRVCLMCIMRMRLSLRARYGVPQYEALFRYEAWFSKKSFSAFRARSILFLFSISRCPLLTTGTYPRRSGMILPARMSTTSVPVSIRSILVSTPIVLWPSGSTSLASFKPSELARSTLAAVTANMIALAFWICFRTISLICFSISLGWSPTGTFVRPGRSTRVRVRTLGEYIRRLMGCGEMPTFRPAFASVSLTISSLILPKS